MAVQPFHSPRVRYLDSNGNPLSGGLLYSYAAGTSTPLSTYTTRAGDVANTNPVVLNANGEADIWCTPNVSYKFVLKDSAGVTQWTADNVPSLPDLSLVPLEIGDGTVAAPAISFINDPDAGLYRVGSDSVGMSVSGVQRQRWTSSGTVITGSAEVTGITTLTGGISVGAGITMTGANPASATGYSNTGTPKNLVKAWGTVTTDGAGGVSLADGFNVASVAISVTDILVTLANGMANTNYAVLVTTMDSASTTYNLNSVVFAKTTTSFKIARITADDGIYVNSTVTARGLAFLVLGAQ